MKIGWIDGRAEQNSAEREACLLWECLFIIGADIRHREGRRGRSGGRDVSSPALLNLKRHKQNRKNTKRTTENMFDSYTRDDCLFCYLQRLSCGATPTYFKRSITQLVAHHDQRYLSTLEALRIENRYRAHDSFHD